LQRVTIESLPDEVLLEVFYFLLTVINKKGRFDFGPQGWLELVHVCRRWRCVIFASPLRLDLELHCSEKKHVRNLLHIWPELPLVISWYDEGFHPDSDDVERLDNVIAALEHRDRVRGVHLLDLSSATFEPIMVVMQEPFLALTSLSLMSSYETLTVPDTFLDRSAPSLQLLALVGISFPSFPRLLSSATHLTSLELYRIPNVGYISPESMATCLSALTNLEHLLIEFESPTPHPRRRDRPRPPPIPAVLPALTTLDFYGVSEWLEVLAARIDAPLLNNITIGFFNQLIFDTPQVARLIGHIELSRPSTLCLYFNPSCEARLSYSDDEALIWTIRCDALDWQVHAVAQLCTQILPLCSSVDILDIKFGFPWDPEPPLEIRPDDMDPAQWLKLFHSFTSVQSLVIHPKLGPFIGAALQELTEQSAAEVFPELNKLSIYGPTTDRAAQQGIESFATARQHSRHPVAVERY
jgi:F-box-like